MDAVLKGIKDIKTEQLEKIGERLGEELKTVKKQNTTLENLYYDKLIFGIIKKLSREDLEQEVNKIYKKIQSLRKKNNKIFKIIF